MPRVLFAGSEAVRGTYLQQLPPAFRAEGLDVDLVTEGDPATIDYIIYDPGGPISDFSPFIRARAVLSLWAGVEKIVTNPTLTQPLARMVDPGLTQGMVEWVTGHVLRHHLGMDTHILGQDGIWREDSVPPLAAERPVGILGLGALGAACAHALVQLGFPVSGWSRSPKSLQHVRCESGEEGLAQVLSGASIIVLLLPLTAETENLLNRDRLSMLRPGAILLNPGRGPLIDDAALIDALDQGQVAHATLDVFRKEPLPKDHPYWSHPAVTVTPHIASATRPATAATAVARNIARAEAGEEILNLVDRSRGY